MYLEIKEMTKIGNVIHQRHQILIF